MPFLCPFINLALAFYLQAFIIEICLLSALINRYLNPYTKKNGFSTLYVNLASTFFMLHTKKREYPVNVNYKTSSLFAIVP